MACIEKTEHSSGRDKGYDCRWLQSMAVASELLRGFITKGWNILCTCQFSVFYFPRIIFLNTCTVFLISLENLRPSNSILIKKIFWIRSCNVKK